MYRQTDSFNWDLPPHTSPPETLRFARAPKILPEQNGHGNGQVSSFVTHTAPKTSTLHTRVRRVTRETMHIPFLETGVLARLPLRSRAGGSPRGRASRGSAGRQT